MATVQPLTQKELERLVRESQETQTLTGAAALQARLLYDIALHLNAIGPASTSTPGGATGATGAQAPIPAAMTPASVELAGPVPEVTAPSASPTVSAPSGTNELSELLSAAQALVASLRQAPDDQARHKLELDDMARIVRAEAQGSLNVVLDGIRAGVKLSVSEITGAIAELQKACECKAPCAGPVNVIVSDLQRPTDSILEAAIKADQAAIAELRCSLDEAVKRCGELKDTASTLCEFRDWAKPALDQAQIVSLSTREAVESAQEFYNNLVSQFSGVSNSLASIEDSCVQQALRSEDQQASIDRALAEIAALRLVVEQRCDELSGRCEHLLDRHTAHDAALAKLAERHPGDTEHHPSRTKSK